MMSVCDPHMAYHHFYCCPNLRETLLDFPTVLLRGWLKNPILHISRKRWLTHTHKDPRTCTLVSTHERWQTLATHGWAAEKLDTDFLSSPWQRGRTREMEGLNSHSAFLFLSCDKCCSDGYWLWKLHWSADVTIAAAESFTLVVFNLEKKIPLMIKAACGKLAISLNRIPGNQAAVWQQPVKRWWLTII